MATVNLGRVAYVNKGAYSASTVYTKYDVVLYNNGSYVYKYETDTSGNLPTNTTYWDVMLDPTALNTAVSNANTATTNANNAKDAANAAAAAATAAAATTVNNVKVNNTTITKDQNNNVNIPLATFSNDGAMSKEDKAALDALANLVEINDWDDIAEIVKAGAGNRYFPVGTQLTTDRSSGDPYVWDVVHNGTVVDPNTGNTKPAMYLLLHNVIYGRQFDAGEALYYVDETTWPSGLAAGTYHFVSSGHSNANIQFTTTILVPAGGQITFSFNETITSCKVNTYGTLGGTTALESDIACLEGSDGTLLGTTDGNSLNMNINARIRYGSNNYQESAIRQWLNSNSDANGWWLPTNKFDRPCSYANVDGFMKGLDAKFLAAVGETNIPCKTNNTFELPGWTLNTAYTVQDKFFLASRDELGFGTEGVAEGSVWALYDGATNADRIKYDISAASTARYWWMRSPDPGSAIDVRRVYTVGSLNYLHANNGIGAVPACIIC